VVRFATTAEGGITVLAEDAAALKAFLNSVLERKRKRLSGRLNKAVAASATVP